MPPSPSVLMGTFAVRPRFFVLLRSASMPPSLQAAQHSHRAFRET